MVGSKAQRSDAVISSFAFRAEQKLPCAFCCMLLAEARLNQSDKSDAEVSCSTFLLSKTTKTRENCL